jgi:hypothetical protein
LFINIAKNGHFDFNFFDCKELMLREKCHDMKISEGPVQLGSTGTETSTGNPVFVVGVLRSGTSLLYSLLNQHPDMAFMYECDAWNFPELLSGARFKGNWLERLEFYNQALSRHRLIYGKSLRGLESVRTPEDLYKVYGDGKGAALWGEKSPFYCSRLLQLAQRNPGSPFILIWRDPVEIYRSVLLAGRTTRFFRRPGMLSRLIVYQEQMHRQAMALEKAGARVHHVTYADLIDKTSEVCREICEFLHVPFDPRMLALSEADLSAVYQAAQHNHLRGGVIQRRQISEEVVDADTARKLGRFRNRWTRMDRARCFGANLSVDAGEPSILERGYHQIAGNLLCAFDGAKRALFEFLPLPWLRTYRGTTGWFFAERQGPSEPELSLRNQITTHWVTILVSGLLLALLGTLDSLNPHLTFLPFYMVLCAFLALTINWRWGSFAALIGAGIGPAVLGKIDTSFAHIGVFAWNTGMRFLLLHSIVLLFDRVRREVSSGKIEKA